MYEFESDVDSIAFGKRNTVLDGLLFVTHNNGTNSQGSELTMIDLSTGRQLSAARGGTRGDVVTTTRAGRILVSQSNQVDILSPQLAPTIIAVNPPNEANVALPMSLVTLTFDDDMFAGDPNDAGSVRNPANYQLTPTNGPPAKILAANYDPLTRTVLLTVADIVPEEYTLTVADSVQRHAGVELTTPFVTQFTAVSDFAALVRVNFTNSRLDRANETVSYDVTVTNIGDRQLVLPLLLVLNPAAGYAGIPQGIESQTSDGRWLINLAGNVPGGVSLLPNESSTGRTIVVQTPNNQRVEYSSSVSAGVGPNQAPVFTSVPIVAVAAGQLYEYPSSASDPDRTPVYYVLVESPAGMTVDSSTGLVRWQTSSRSLADASLILRAYDVNGAWAQQEIAISVAGGNHAPQFAGIPPTIIRSEGEVIASQQIAVDSDGDPLRYWATNLPGGAVYDPISHAIYWQTTTGDAGTHRVRLHVSDGNAESIVVQNIEVRPADLAPVFDNPGGRLLREGDVLRVQLHAADPNGDAVTYSVIDLPDGASLHPLTGLFEWTPGYSQTGEYVVTFVATANGKSTTHFAPFVVLNANAAPVFDPIERWRVFEGQEVLFRVFADDPDNPDFIPPARLDDGELVYQGTSPTVVLAPTNLPEGATFDRDTGLFRWTPDYVQAGEYLVTFTAIDDGDGTGEQLTSRVTVPIHVRNLNRRPEIPELSNIVVTLGETRELIVPIIDPDGSRLTLRAESGLTGRALPSFITFVDRGNGQGVFTITPGAGIRGNHSVGIFATDDGDGEGLWARLGASSTFVVHVESENDPPQIAPLPSRVAIAGQPFSITMNVTDLDEEFLTFELSGLPGATIEEGVRYGTAEISWTPTVSQVGTYQATVRVTDDGADGFTDPESDTATFQVIVRATNNTPAFQVPALVTVNEGATLNLPLGATDADGDPLWFEATQELPSGVKLDATSGLLTWTPNLVQAGSYSVPVRVSDGVGTVNRTLLIDVLDTNQSPIFVSSVPLYVREGSSLRFAVAVGDPDGDSVIVAATNLPAGATFDPVTNSFQWTPTFDQAGLYSVQFAGRDDRGGQTTETITIRVDEVNRSPSLNLPNRSGTVGRLMDFSIAASDLDTNASFTYSAISLPSGATLESNTGRFRWTPGPAQAGDYVLVFRVSDGLATTSQNVLIRVSPQPEVPQVRIDVTPSFPAIPGQTVTVRVTASSLSGISQLKLFADGRPVTLDAFGQAIFIAGASGRIRLNGEATSVDGVVGTAAGQIRIRNPQDAAGPVVGFSNFTAGSIVQFATEIRRLFLI